MLLGHRYYDSSTGRFLSRDPVQDGDNRYAYCGNDPVNAEDTEGLTPAGAAIILRQTGQAIAVDETFGLGPENPVADVIAVGIGVIGLGIAVVILMQPDPIILMSPPPMAKATPAPTKEHTTTKNGKKWDKHTKVRPGAPEKSMQG